MKCGIVDYNKYSISFDNGSRIKSSTMDNKNSCYGYSINHLIINIEKKLTPIFYDIYRSLFPTVTLRSGKIAIITENISNNIINNLFKEKNTFKKIILPYTVVPNRNGKWKEEMIKNIGIDNFKIEYELCDLSSDINNNTILIDDIKKLMIENDISIEDLRI